MWWCSLSTCLHPGMYSLCGGVLSVHAYTQGCIPYVVVFSQYMPTPRDVFPMWWCSLSTCLHPGMYSLCGGVLSVHASTQGCIPYPVVIGVISQECKHNPGQRYSLCRWCSLSTCLHPGMYSLCGGVLSVHAYTQGCIPYVVVFSQYMPTPRDVFPMWWCSLSTCLHPGMYSLCGGVLSVHAYTQGCIPCVVVFSQYMPTPRDVFPMWWCSLSTC